MKKELSIRKGTMYLTTIIGAAWLVSVVFDIIGATRWALISAPVIMIASLAVFLISSRNGLEAYDELAMEYRNKAGFKAYICIVIVFLVEILVHQILIVLHRQIDAIVFLKIDFGLIQVIYGYSMQKYLAGDEEYAED